MKKTVIVCAAACAALVSMAEVPADYDAGEKSAELITPEVAAAASQMLGGDMAGKLVHAIKLQMAKYDRDMQSKSGRSAWHGKLLRTEVYTNDLVSVEVYSNEVDGAVWRYRQPFAVRNPKQEVLDANARLKMPVMTNGIPARLAAARLRRQEEKNTISNVTVNIEVGGR